MTERAYRRNRPDDQPGDMWTRILLRSLCRQIDHVTAENAELRKELGRRWLQDRRRAKAAKP
jgi:hypothetical protein